MITDSKGAATEAQQYVWGGAIPLQIHLHESEVTTLPPPPPALILAPRVGYLPLLVPQIKPFFSSSLPPGVDTVWFEYKGLPLKWYIPTGTLFDLLCSEPERPWNLTIHFRGYPANLLIPCEGEDSVKWSFINALKEAAYIINGNCKNIMNMSQSDQTELWRSVLNGQLEAYLRVYSKLKLDIVGDNFSLKLNTSRQTNSENEATGTTKSGKIPVRLYVRTIDEDVDELEDAPIVDSWENIYYINCPVEIHGEGKAFSLNDAIKALLPMLFTEEASVDVDSQAPESESGEVSDGGSSRGSQKNEESLSAHTGIFKDGAEIKLVRIQGIEPRLDIPFGWVAKNLMNPEQYLHICIYVKAVQP
ncbi:autophagy protein 5-like isoform X1 [Salvia splendens]|uniref:autophagy protein 5-like isoform X1 n=1 Tax=Salvia splendens TaxID=180675 RepID=UPI001C2582EE|nr:autophagy protein 5-like isoform X1 [Salvia splendens]